MKVIEIDGLYWQKAMFIFPDTANDDIIEAIIDSIQPEEWDETVLLDMNLDDSLEIYNVSTENIPEYLQLTDAINCALFKFINNWEEYNGRIPVIKENTNEQIS